MAHRAIVAAAMAVVVGGALMAAGHQESAAQSEARKLEGTWRVQITLRDCQTGAALRPPFPAMATFAARRTVTTSDGGVSPLVRGAGHGVWQHTGAHTFAALTEAFLFTSTGTSSGTLRIRQSIEIGADPDEFTATVGSEILDPQGMLLMAGCATSVGRRMES